MNRILPLLVLIIFPFIVSGQQKFQNAYFGSAQAYLNTVLESYTGEIIAGGSLRDPVTNIDDALLICTNATGDTLWTRVFGNGGQDWFTKIIQTSDSAFVAIGTTTDVTPFSNDIMLVKFDINGNVIWFNRIGFTSGDNGADLFQSQDGGFILTGNISVNSLEVFVMKTDASGIPLWTYRYLGSVTGGNIIPLLNGGYLFNVRKNSGFSLCKIDTAGTVQWNKQFYNGTTSPGTFSMQQFADSTILIATRYLDPGSIDYRMLFVKTNQSGDTLWTRSYGNSVNMFGTSMIVNSDGSFLIAGRTSIDPLSPYTSYLAKFNNSGDFLWAKEYDDTLHTSFLYSIARVSDGGILMAGTKLPDTSYPASAYLLKTDSVGVSSCLNQPIVLNELNNSIQTISINQGRTTPTINFVSQIPVVKYLSGYIDVCSLLSIYDIHSTIYKNDFKVSPNPSSSAVKIEFNRPLNSGKLMLFDNLGMKVIELNNLNGITYQLDVVNIKSGLYFINISDSRESMIQKLIIEK